MCVQTTPMSILFVAYVTFILFFVFVCILVVSISSTAHIMIGDLTKCVLFLTTRTFQHMGFVLSHHQMAQHFLHRVSLM